MWFILLAKSFLCGISLLIPGVGATSAAIALGVLSRLSNAVSALKKDRLAAISVLLPAAAGLLLGAYAAAKPIALLRTNAPVVSNIVFCVLSFWCALTTIKHYAAPPCIKSICLATTGALFALAADRSAGILGGGSDSPTVFFIGGIIAAIALILPGISFSYTLLSIGVYDKFLMQFYAPDISFLLPFSAGICISAIAFMLVLKRVAGKNSKGFYAFIGGMMLFAAAVMLKECLVSIIYR